jgi:hypothetical protein
MRYVSPAEIEANREPTEAEAKRMRRIKEQILAEKLRAKAMEWPPGESPVSRLKASRNYSIGVFRRSHRVSEADI